MSDAASPSVGQPRFGEPAGDAKSASSWCELIELMPVAVLLSGPDGQIRAANTEAERLFACARSELLHANLFELMDPDQAMLPPQPLSQEGAHSICQRGTTARFGKHPKREVDVSVRRVQATEEEWLVVSLHDVGPHCEAQRAAERDARELRLATSSARLGVWQWDLRTNALQWDARMCEIFGLEGEPAAGYEVWRQRVFPEDLQRLESAIRRALAEHRDVHEVYRIRLADGSVRVLEGSARGEYDEAGVPVRLVGTDLDITAQREAEEQLAESEARFRSAMEYAAIGIALLDLDGRFLKVNHALCEIVGYSEAELTQLTFQAITHPEDLDADLKQADALRRGEISHYHMEKRYLHKDGRVVWVLLSGSLVRSGDGEPRMFVAEIQDITQRKLTEQRLRASLAEKEVLLKEVHHRVKNNLQVISSILRLQSEKLRGTPLVSAFEDAQHRITSMALIHERLYQTGDLATVDFGAHLRDLSNMLVRFYSENQAQIRLKLAVEKAALDLDTAIPLGLLANEILTNALKHAFVGRAEGTVSVALSERDGQLTLAVADDGVPFPVGVDIESGSSLGMRLIRLLARQLRAKVELQRDHEKKVSVTMPVPRLRS